MQKLKWFKFLIYFGLWAAAVISVISAVVYFTGFMYEDAATFYNIYGKNMKTLDIVYGILLILLAALIIVARYRLAAFKPEGTILLYCAIAMNVLMIIGYAVAAFVITDVNAIFNIGNILQIAIWIVILGLNYLYFKKRKNMFNKE